MANKFKAPSWKTRAVWHSCIVAKRQAKRQAEELRKEQTSGYFINSEESASNRFKGVPKNKGRRLHLETIEDSERDMTNPKFKGK